MTENEKVNEEETPETEQSSVEAPVTTLEQIAETAAEEAQEAVEEENEEVLVTEHRTLRQDVWKQFIRHRGALFGLAFMALISLVVVVGPFLYPHDPYEIPKAEMLEVKTFVDASQECPTSAEGLTNQVGETLDGYSKGDEVKVCLNIKNVGTGLVNEFLLRDPQGGRDLKATITELAPGEEYRHEYLLELKRDGEKTKLNKFKASAQPLRNAGPSATNVAGTDNLGRDVIARVLIGGRISLSVGIAAMLVGLLIGVAVGVLSGYFRALDAPLMALTDLFLALPILPLLLLVIALFREPLRAMLGESLGIFVLVVVIIGATSWMQTARIVRGDVLAIKEQEFVIAARSLGAKPRRVILNHIVPNVLSPVTVSASLGVSTAIITESALSFLGLGFPADFPTWGRLLYDAKDYMDINVWRVLWPGMLISLTVIAVNFVGDGLRDALDPKLRSKSD